MTTDDRIDIYRGMFWNLVDTHIDGIPVDSHIFFEIKDLPDEVLGSCDYSKELHDDLWEGISIEINEKIFSDELITDDDITDIIIHEFAHMICGPEDDETAGHSPLWETVCTALGGNLNFY